MTIEPASAVAFGAFVAAGAAGDNEAWTRHTAEYERRVTEFLDEHLGANRSGEKPIDRAAEGA